SLGIQVHGGMGFIEETGAARHLRDARILPIYEGTNGIQALDLVHRKIVRDNGEALDEYLDELDSLINRLNGLEGDQISTMRAYLAEAVDCLDKTKDWILTNKDNAVKLGASASSILTLFGIVAGGANLALSMTVALDKLHAGDGDLDFYKQKVITCLFYAENMLTKAPAYLTAITEGCKSLELVESEMF
ncbi:MAG: acyl-CoA dehydrogenase, partial [Alphaproteobacteria bacterium]|nr:acyl-CoA dehydrogenase [Alphaproteobacteria bacterium]